MAISMLPATEKESTHSAPVFSLIFRNIHRFYNVFFKPSQLFISIEFRKLIHQGIHERNRISVRVDVTEASLIPLVFDGYLV